MFSNNRYRILAFILIIMAIIDLAFIWFVPLFFPRELFIMFIIADLFLAFILYRFNDDFNDHNDNFPQGPMAP